MNAESRAHIAYRKTSDTAMASSIIQAVFALPGGWLHLAVDGAAVAFYIDLWNEIRVIYGRGKISRQAALAYLRPNLTFILGDLLLDKLLGMLPFAGSFFCFLFARAITWRLGAFFALTSALGEEVPSNVMLEKIAYLVQALFPRGDFLFTLSDPDKALFISLIAGLEGLDGAQAEARITTALNVLRGEYTVEEIEILVEDDTDDDDWEDGGAAIGEVVEPLAPRDGGLALAEEDDESAWGLALAEEDGPMPWEGVMDAEAEEEAALVAAWESVWRQWKAFQRQALTEESEAEALAAAMPQLRLLAEIQRQSPARPLLLALNERGEIEAADGTGQEDVPITQGHFVMPTVNDDDAVAAGNAAIPSVAASPKRPAATPPKKKTTTKKKVVVKAKSTKTSG